MTIKTNTTNTTNTTTNFKGDTNMTTKIQTKLEELRRENEELKLENESVYLDDSFTDKNVPKTKSEYPAKKYSNKNAIVEYHYNSLLNLANKYIYSYGLQGRIEKEDLANEAVVYLLNDYNFKSWLNKCPKIQYLSFVSKAVRRIMIDPLKQFKGYDLFEENQEYELPDMADRHYMTADKSKMIKACETLSQTEFTTLLDYISNGLKGRAKHIVRKGKEIFQFVKEFLRS